MKLLKHLATVALATLLATCTDFGTGPTAGTAIRAQFALAPAYPSYAHGALLALADAGLPLDRVRILITRPGTGDVLKDTTVTMHEGDPGVTLDLDVLALNGETLDADLQFKSGETILFDGHAPVTAVSVVAASGNTQPTVITVSYVGPGAKATKVVVTPATATLSSTDATTFTAQAFDSSGAVIANTPFSWTVSDPTLGAIAATGVFTPAGKRGVMTVTAATPTQLSGASADTVVPPPTKIVVVSGDKQSAPILTAAGQPLVVAVLAADNIGVPNQTVTFAATDGGTIAPATVVTDAAGKAQATLKIASRLGAYGFTATSGAFSVAATANGTVGAATQMSASGPTTFTITSGVIPTSPSKILVADAGKNPVPGISITADITTATGATQATLTTDANGLASLPNAVYLGAIAGTMTIKLSNATLSGSPITFTAAVVAGAAKSIAISAGNNQSTAPGTAVAIKPAVIVKDTNGNVVAGTTVTFAVASGGGSVTGATPTSGTDGVATVGSWTVGTASGTNTLTATATGLVGSPLTFTATTAWGPLDHFTVTATDGSAIGTQVVGTPFNVMITAKDANNNTVGDYAGTPTLSGTGLTAGSGTLPAFSAGILASRSVTMGTVGTSFHLAVTDGTITGSSNSFAVIPGPTTQLIITTAAAGAVNGVAFTTQPVVTLKDALGNVATNDVTPVTFSVVGPATVIAGATVTVTPVNGVVTFTNVGVNATPGSTVSLKYSHGTTATVTQTIVPSSLPNVWINSASGVWSVASNWSQNRAPLATDSVVIGGSSTYTVTMDVPTFTSTGYIIVGGTSGRQTLSTTSDTITVNNSLLVGPHGAYVSTGSFNLGAGTIVNQGTLVLNGAASVSLMTNALTNQDSLIVSGVVSAGAISTTTSSVIRIGQIDNAATGATLASSSGFTNNGTIELTNVTSDASDAGLVLSTGTLTNVGTIHSAGGQTPGGQRAIAAIINNQHSILLDAPTIIAQVNGGVGTNAGTINASATTTLDLVTGTFTNNGTITAAAGDTLEVAGGRFTSSSGATLTGAGVLFFYVDTANVESSIQLSSLVVDAAQLSISSAQSLNTFLLNGAAITGTGSLTNPASDTLKLYGSSIAVPVSNLGVIAASGASSITGALTTTLASKLLIAQADGNATAANLTLNASLDNLGTIELGATDTGCNVCDAQLTLTTGTLTNESGATISTVDRTSATGARQIVAPVDNKGTLNVNLGASAAGTLQINGSLVNESTGTINLDMIQQTNPGANDMITTTGNVTFGGTLVLLGYQPPSGTFQLINSTAGSLSGTFSTFTYGGFAHILTYGASVLSVSVVSFAP